MYLMIATIKNRLESACLASLLAAIEMSLNYLSKGSAVMGICSR